MRFLFVCGCPHSGTSLMLGIFANASNVVVATDETFALNKMSILDFKIAIKNKVSAANLFVEKTPRHVHHLEKICADEESEALVLLRNPIDVVASLKKRGFSLEEAIARYIHDNLVWQSYAEHKKVSIIRYEDLVEKTSPTLYELGETYQVDLLQANLKREQDRRLYFKGHGANRSEKTDGYGHDAHLALRNYQMRQPIKNMNGAWRGRLSRREFEMVIEWCAAPLQKFYSDLDFNF